MALGDDLRTLMSTRAYHNPEYIEQVALNYEETLPARMEVAARSGLSFLEFAKDLGANGSANVALFHRLKPWADRERLGLMLCSQTQGRIAFSWLKVVWGKMPHESA